MKVEELSLEEKIGQMLIITINERKITKRTIEMIEKYKVGGVVLYYKDYHNYSEMLNLVNKLKEINQKNRVPLFISIDQEGGRVNRMPNEIHNLKNAYALANTKDVELVKKSGALIGKMLKQTGINLNYAPVLDIKRFAEDHPIGNRCYGDNKEEVGIYGIEVMKQMQKQGIISAIKHFPGHGTTKKDSHYRIPSVNISLEELLQEDMQPFEKAIQEGADAIMVGHLLVRQVDKKYPASLSKKIVKENLRKRYQYEGLSITDDLKMWAVKLHYSKKQAVRKAIEAGNDLVMLGFSYRQIKKTIHYIEKKVKSGIINIKDIERSVNRIIQMKEKYHITDEKVEEMNIEEINKEIDEINLIIEEN